MILLLIQSMLLSLFIVISVSAQEINFKDLNRPGKPLNKSYSIKGVGKEGDQYISRFNETDSGRVAARERSRSNYTASPVASSSNTSSSTASPDKKFVCTLTCESGESVVFAHKGGEMTLEVFASDRDDAVRNAIKEGDKRCKGGTFRPVFGSAAYCK